MVHGTGDDKRALAQRRDFWLGEAAHRSCRDAADFGSCNLRRYTVTLIIVPRDALMVGNWQTYRIALHGYGRSGNWQAVRLNASGNTAPDDGPALPSFATCAALLARALRLRGRAQLPGVVAARSRLLGKACMRCHSAEQYDHQRTCNDLQATRLRHDRAHLPACGASGSAAGVAGPSPPRKNICSAGTTTSNKIGPISIPPTMTVASGRCTWLPMPVEMAAGNRPMQAERVIINIGRICCSTA